MDVMEVPETGALNITVVVVTRNRCAELCRSLERIVTLPERPAVVVVDNASDDSSPGVVRRTFGSTVEVVALPANRGAVARNVGIARARSELVAFSDDDSWWEPGALRQASEIFAASPRLGLLAAHVLVEPRGLADPTCTEMGESPLPRSSARSTTDGRPLPAVLGFLACGAVARRTALADVGAFRPELGTGGEEEALALDLADAGWELAYAAEVVARHRPSSLRHPRGRRREVVRNSLWTAWRRRPVPSAARRTVAVVGAQADLAAVLGLIEAVRGLRVILADRRVVHPDVEHAVRVIEGHRRHAR